MSGPSLLADPGAWVRGIIVRQPWATCVLAGKDMENRPVHWQWRWILLHAGQTTERAPLVALRRIRTGETPENFTLPGRGVWGPA